MIPDLRVIVAEDHYLVREGIRRALEDAGDIEVIATVGSAVELVDSVSREAPDVIVTDIRMPPGHHTEGIDAALSLRAITPSLGVVVLSQYAEAAYAMELLRDGNEGLAYLLKERVGRPDQLIEAVREVASGGSVIDPDVVATLVAQNRQRPSSPLSDLTEREMEVLEQMAQGRTNAGVADQLHLSESSVEKYSTSIFLKLGLTDEPQVHRRVAAVLTLLHEESRAQPL